MKSSMIMVMSQCSSVIVNCVIVTSSGRRKMPTISKDVWITREGKEMEAAIERLREACFGEGEGRKIFMEDIAKLLHAVETAPPRASGQEVDVEALLRERWWLTHGCPVSMLYGDDGEMQCSTCGADFKRWPLDQLSPLVSNPPSSPQEGNK